MQLSINLCSFSSTCFGLIRPSSGATDVTIALHMDLCYKLLIHWIYGICSTRTHCRWSSYRVHIPQITWFNELYYSMHGLLEPSEMQVVFGDREDVGVSCANPVFSLRMLSMDIQYLLIVRLQNLSTSWSTIVSRVV